MSYRQKGVGVLPMSLHWVLNLAGRPQCSHHELLVPKLLSTLLIASLSAQRNSQG